MPTREQSKEITPPPPIQGIIIPRDDTTPPRPLLCDRVAELSSSATVKMYIFYKVSLVNPARMVY